MESNFFPFWAPNIYHSQEEKIIQCLTILKGKLLADNYLMTDNLNRVPYCILNQKALIDNKVSLLFNNFMALLFHHPACD